MPTSGKRQRALAACSGALAAFDCRAATAALLLHPIRSAPVRPPTFDGFDDFPAGIPTLAQFELETRPPQYQE